MGEHLEKARQQLQSLMPAKAAEKLYNTYEDYLHCEMQLQNEFRNFADAQNPKEAIELLERIQEFRRAQRRCGKKAQGHQKRRKREDGKRLSPESCHGRPTGL